MPSDTIRASARDLLVLLAKTLRRPKSKPNATGTPHITAMPMRQSNAISATATTAVEIYEPYK